tara:strand:+ start:398 stop:559 length:162 start_codon:yes stop_codon:yes gene_type:complete
MEEKQLKIVVKDKPHTFEIGRAGHRHTIAYNTTEELKKHLDSLKAMGYLEEEA